MTKRKHKGKLAKLKLESFESDFTTKRHAGFYTNRPVRWALALEKYTLENPDIKKSTGNIKTTLRQESIAILMSFWNIHYSWSILVLHLILEPSLLDGDHNYWIKNEFPKVAEVFKEQREYDKGEATDEKLRDEMSTSIDCLWLKN